MRALPPSPRVAVSASVRACSSPSALLLAPAVASMAERRQKFLPVAWARLLLLAPSVVQTSRGKTAIASLTASALIAAVSVQASTWRCWALSAAVA